RRGALPGRESRLLRLRAAREGHRARVDLHLHPRRRAARGARQGLRRARHRQEEDPGARLGRDHGRSRAQGDGRQRARHHHRLALRLHVEEPAQPEVRQGVPGRRGRPQPGLLLDRRLRRHARDLRDAQENGRQDRRRYADRGGEGPQVGKPARADDDRPGHARRSAERLHPPRAEGRQRPRQRPLRHHSDGKRPGRGTQKTEVMLSSLAAVLFDGFAYGMLLFLLSVGLSVTLGMMNFVNLAHCSFAMVGGYAAVTLANRLGWPFLATLPMAFLAAALVSIPLERILFRRLYRASDLDQCLLTIGIVFVSIAAYAWFYTTEQQSVPVPSYLQGSIQAGGMSFASYRIFLIVVGLAVTALLFFFLEKTRFGAQVRAAVDNQRMARGLGIDVDRSFMITFALGGGLAGLGGALSIQVVGLDPSFALSYLVYVLIVVAVGGLGSIGGSFAAAVVLGISDMAGKYYVPWLGAFLIYLVMVALLMWRPLGLFGKR